MELRNHFKGELWHNFWDVGFAASSGLLILLFGVALGNLLRGVPLDKNEYFQGTFAFLLNPYSLLVGVFAVVALAQHAATFLALRMEGAPAQRSLAFLRRVWWAVLALYLGVERRDVPGPRSPLVALALRRAVSLPRRAGCDDPAAASRPLRGSVRRIVAVRRYAARRSRRIAVSVPDSRLSARQWRDDDFRSFAVGTLA